MWAQIIKARLKPGTDAELESMREEFRSRLGQRSGLLHSFTMRNQRDPQEIYTLIVFESEEAAREGERDLEQNPSYQRMRSFQEGTPEYVDLDVIDAGP